MLAPLPPCTTPTTCGRPMARNTAMARSPSVSEAAVPSAAGTATSSASALREMFRNARITVSGHKRAQLQRVPQQDLFETRQRQRQGWLASVKRVRAQFTISERMPHCAHLRPSSATASKSSRLCGGGTNVSRSLGRPCTLTVCGASPPDGAAAAMTTSSEPPLPREGAASQAAIRAPNSCSVSTSPA